MRAITMVLALGTWAIVGCGGYEPAAPPPAAPGKAGVWENTTSATGTSETINLTICRTALCTYLRGSS